MPIYTKKILIFWPLEFFLKIKTLMRMHKRAPKFCIGTSKIIPDLWSRAVFCPIKEITPPYWGTWQGCNLKLRTNFDWWIWTSEVYNLNYENCKTGRAGTGADTKSEDKPVFSAEIICQIFNIWRFLIRKGMSMS